MQEPDMPDEELEMLDTIAATFVPHARADVAERFEGLETLRMNLESLIDNCSDHNQLMLNSLRDCKPSTFVKLEEFLQDDLMSDFEPWMNFLNDLFDRARKSIEEQLKS